MIRKYIIVYGGYLKFIRGTFNIESYEGVRYLIKETLLRRFNKG